MISEPRQHARAAERPVERPAERPVERLLDAQGRPLESLRLSVTDRCNLRCRYCMPESEYTWLPRRDLLTFEEIDRLVDVFLALGVRKVRLTGGEPLLRRGLPALVRLLTARRPALADLALTTNGVRLAEQAAALRAAGLRRVTVSLDTLRPERQRALSGGSESKLPQVLAGIDAVRAAGFDALKLDCVIIRGVNDDEIFDLIEHGRRIGAEVRFIEYMDVGGATGWSAEQVVSRAEILARIDRRRGPLAAIDRGAGDDNAPADRFRLADGTVIGVIGSTTEPFCAGCDRSRLTADGRWLLCLYADEGIDLRTPLRAGAAPDAIAQLIVEGWHQRDARGAEERRRAADRGVLHRRPALHADPHLEMHTRGG